jgi:hypothetical protein
MDAKGSFVESKGADVQNEWSYTASFSYTFMRAQGKLYHYLYQYTSAARHMKFFQCVT